MGYTGCLLCYSHESNESAIAENFEAMVKLRALKTRMKDFYYIWLLSRQFEGAVLAEAVRRAFARRAIELSDEIVAFSEDFAVEKQAQWTASRRRLQSDAAPAEFKEVAVAVAVNGFLAPVVEAHPVRLRIRTQMDSDGFLGPGRTASQPPT